MALKNILVHVDASDRAGERIRIAAELAGPDDGHLTGVFVTPDPPFPTWMVAGMPASALEAAIENTRSEGEAARGRFLDIAERAGVHAEWRSASGSVARVTAQHARYADLAVVGKGSADDPARYPYPELAADLTMSCGRPVLVVPNSGRFDRLGRHVLVCWNASREATRAVNDAMPLLQRAEKVVVLSVNPHRPSGGDHGEIPSANIALHLARHGVNAEAANTTADGISVADIVLSHVSDRGIDLIVSGAWGHSRMREWAFGGVTESLLRDVTVPALMSH
ncbi:MAG: universal stress protein [Alphaproteobacteria bacterium]|nr:universal stress protein [Alphaproteobacteria bacterium]